MRLFKRRERLPLERDYDPRYPFSHVKVIVLSDATKFSGEAPPDTPPEPTPRGDLLVVKNSHGVMEVALSDDDEHALRQYRGDPIPKGERSFFARRPGETSRPRRRKS